MDRVGLVKERNLPSGNELRTANYKVLCALSANQLFDYVPMDVGQPTLKTIVVVAQALMV